MYKTASKVGVCKQMCGSTLHMLAFDADLPGNLDERLALVWQELCVAYEVRGTPAGERLSHTAFIHVFDKGRSWNPTRYPTTSCTINHLQALCACFEGRCEVCRDGQ